LSHHANGDDGNNENRRFESPNITSFNNCSIHRLIVTFNGQRTKNSELIVENEDQSLQ